MKKLGLFLCVASSVSSFFGVALAVDAQIPAFGVICTAKDGSTAMLIPTTRPGEIEVTLTNKGGVEIASNLHTVVKKNLNDRTVFEIESWLEMDQVAKFVMFSGENLAKSKFSFQFDAQDELGLPRVFSECDVM